MKHHRGPQSPSQLGTGGSPRERVPSQLRECKVCVQRGVGEGLVRWANVFLTTLPDKLAHAQETSQGPFEVGPALGLLPCLVHLARCVSPRPFRARPGGLSVQPTDRPTNSIAIARHLSSILALSPVLSAPSQEGPMAADHQPHGYKN